MKKILGQLWRLLLIVALGFTGSLIAGLMSYGTEVFELQSSAFAYFVIYGISTSFIFAFYHVRGLSETITAAVTTGAIIFVLASFLMPQINSAIWSFGVCLSVIVIAFLFERKMANIRQWRFIFVGIYYGALFVILFLIVGIVTNVIAFPPSIFQQIFFDGLRLGLGVGVGVEVAEAIIHSVDLQKQTKSGKKIVDKKSRKRIK